MKDEIKTIPECYEYNSKIYRTLPEAESARAGAHIYDDFDTSPLEDGNDLLRFIKAHETDILTYLEVRKSSKKIDNVIQFVKRHETEVQSTVEYKMLLDNIMRMLLCEKYKSWTNDFENAHGKPWPTGVAP